MMISNRRIPSILQNSEYSDRLRVVQAPEWLEAKLADVSVPFLVIHGDADVVTDPAVSKKLYLLRPMH